MKMPLNIKSACLLLIFVISACEEITDYNFKNAQNSMLTVEAFITNEDKIQEIRLTLSFDTFNAEPKAATGAEIIIKAENDIFYFSEDIDQPGLYKSIHKFSAKLHTEYLLEIKWNNEVYSAHNEMVQVLPFTPISFKLVNNNIDTLTFDQTPPGFSPHEMAMYELLVDWNETKPNKKHESKYLYFTFNTLDVSEIFSPSKEFPKFPKGSIVIEKKYSLNSQAAEYFRSILIETEWQGGAFDEASSIINGNLSNGGLGYFWVCGVLSDTLTAQ
jgi:hypothetical protein